MPQSEPFEHPIPILTEIIRGSTKLTAPELETLLAEVQTKLASRAFKLTDELLRSAFAELEATLLEQISSKLRGQLPELIDATLREHFDARGEA